MGDSSRLGPDDVVEFVGSFGAGKFMRHAKLRPERDVDTTALMRLMETAHTDMKGA